MSAYTPNPAPSTSAPSSYRAGDDLPAYSVREWNEREDELRGPLAAIFDEHSPRTHRDHTGCAACGRLHPCATRRTAAEALDRSPT